MAEISALKPGTTAKLGYIRSGKDMSTEVTIADRSKLFAARLNDGEDEDGEQEQPQESKFGISVRSITPDMADR